MIKILVFDANVKRQMAIAFQLVVKGYQVFSTNNGEAAWDSLFRAESRSDLIVIYCPQKGDADFLQRKYKVDEFRRIPVIFLLKGSKKQENDLNATRKHENWSFFCFRSLEGWDGIELTARVEQMISGPPAEKKGENSLFPAGTLYFSQLMKIMGAGRQKILYVEASAVRQEVVASYLEERGFQVIGTTSAAVAWRKLVVEKPDLVILSSMIEGDAGWNQLLAQKGETEEVREIPILFFVQGKREKATALNEEAEGQNWYAIPSVFSAEDLSAAISRFLPDYRE